MKSEDGMGLIEVMASALVLVLAVLGVYAGLDGSSRISGQNRARSVAAALAQEDQEDLRSKQAKDLVNLRRTQTKTVAGVNYTVVSRVDVVNDTSGTVSCTASSSAPDYLQLTSTVSSRLTGEPVTQTSLYTPRNGAFAANTGTMAVGVSDRNGTALQGVAVSLSGPQSLSDTTNSLGCAVFGYVTAGTYTVSLSAPGYVDLTGASTPTYSRSVTANATSYYPLTYDRASTVIATFDTKVSSNPAQSTQASTLELGSSGIPSGSPNPRPFTGPGGSPQSTITAAGLFPFTAGYGVWSGCAAAQPSKNGGTDQTLTVTPGNTSNITVREPAINISVTDSKGKPLSGAHVTFQSSTCPGDTYPAQLTNSSGALPDPGFPFGTYTICADDGSRKATATGIKNNNANSGTTTVGLRPSTGTSGTCT